MKALLRIEVLRLIFAGRGLQPIFRVLYLSMESEKGQGGVGT